MDMKRKRADSDDDEDLEDFIKITKTIEELEILNETFVAKQHKAYRKLNKTVKDLRLHGEKEKNNRKMVELEKMLSISRDENFALKMKIDELEKYKEEKETDFKDLEYLNQNIMVRERKYNYENQEAREELIKSMKGLQVCRNIGIKRLGELDPAPFVIAVKKRKCSGSNSDAGVEAQLLCSLWEKHLRDPGWHPFRIVKVGDKYEEIIDDEDQKLKGLKAELGEDAYKAVTTSLMEMNEYNPSGRYPISEIWNFVEGRKTSLKEGYRFVFEKLKNVGKSSVVSSPSIAAIIPSSSTPTNPSSSAPNPNGAATIPSSSTPTNASSSAPNPNGAATIPSSSTPTNPSSSAPGPNITATITSSVIPSDNLCEIPAEEFHDFLADKSYEKFKPGQIWSMYCYLDDLPRYYVQITDVKSDHFQVHIKHLDSSLSPKHKIRWADKKMPICCGTFSVGDETEVYKDASTFSHMVSAKLVSKNNYEIYPRIGEVWAMFKNFSSKWTCSNLKKCKYDIVEVVGDNVSKIEVLVLEQVVGFKAVFKPKKNSGLDIIREIKEAKLITFSHQIPAFRLTDEKEGSLRGHWKLYPNSMPVHLN